MTSLASTLSTTVTKTSSKALVQTDEPKAAASAVPGKAGRLMTDEEKARVRAAIAAAKSAEEIQKLERSLREGWVPNVNPIGA